MPRSARRTRRVIKASALALAARADEPALGRVSGARTMRWPRWPLALLALAAITGCAALPAAWSPVVSVSWAQESERPFGLFDKIFRGSERTGGERGAAPTAAPEYSSQDRSGPDRGGPDRSGQDRTAQISGPDLVVRLDRLENQIRQLTGIIEQLQYRNQQLEAQIRRMQGLQGMQDDSAPRLSSPPRPQSVPVPSSPVAAGTPGRRGDAFDPSQNPNAPGAPQSLGSINSASQPPTVADAGGYPVGAPGGRPLDPPRNPSAGGQVATLPPSQSPRDEYDLAYGYVLRKDYALAEDGFRNFLSRYPNDRLAGDATYWFGESLFQRQRFRDAAEAFLNVSTKYESNAKAPDALLRLGQSLAALGEKEAACASLGEVLRKFPRASAGVKQGVEREQKRVRC
jgi:tol-pal system protein YbgF